MKYVFSRKSNDILFSIVTREQNERTSYQQSCIVGSQDEDQTALKCKRKIGKKILGISAPVGNRVKILCCCQR